MLHIVEVGIELALADRRKAAVLSVLCSGLRQMSVRCVAQFVARTFRQLGQACGLLHLCQFLFAGLFDATSLIRIDLFFLGNPGLPCFASKEKDQDLPAWRLCCLRAPLGLLAFGFPSTEHCRQKQRTMSAGPGVAKFVIKEVQARSCAMVAKAACKVGL